MSREVDSKPYKYLGGDIPGRGIANVKVPESETSLAPWGIRLVKLGRRVRPGRILSGPVVGRTLCPPGTCSIQDAVLGLSWGKVVNTEY